MVETNVMPRPDTGRAVSAERYGAPPYDRRLSDKILAAFNHAYASGARSVAGRLKAVLAEVEGRERRRHERRASSALDQAERWVEFVEARDGYNALAARRDAAPDEVAAALERMKDAYRRWSDS